MDRVGRKVLLLCGSIQGFLAEIAAAILLAVTYEGGQVIAFMLHSVCIAPAV